MSEIQATSWHIFHQLTITKSVLHFFFALLIKADYNGILLIYET